MEQMALNWRKDGRPVILSVSFVFEAFSFFVSRYQTMGVGEDEDRHLHVTFPSRVRSLAAHLHWPGAVHAVPLLLRTSLSGSPGFFLSLCRGSLRIFLSSCPYSPGLHTPRVCRWCWAFFPGILRLLPSSRLPCFRASLPLCGGIVPRV